MQMSEQEEHQIRQYVEAETPDSANDPVTLVQKVGSRRAAGRTHRLYDVWTAKGGRWWVITEMTNLYSQDDFHSIEEAFVYHVGLCMVLSERGKLQAPDDPEDAINRPWRRYAKAVDAMNDAVEAEDFQAVGVMCREALLALAREHRQADWVVISGEPPKASDFKGWLHTYIRCLTSGRRRAYLEGVADRTWDIAVWLQHYTDATEWDAELVLEATSHMLNTFSLARIRYERGAARRCPQCDSYRVTEDGDVEERAGRVGYCSYEVCPACGWESDRRFEPYTPEILGRMVEYLAGNDEGQRGSADKTD